MYCPGCGKDSTGDVRFCRTCGANLESVQRALTGKSGIDWDKTWLKEMLMSQEERERAEEERDMRRGITPEIKRMNEVKAGVITASIGIGVMIFLYMLLGAVASTLPSKDAVIVGNIWASGAIPFFVGLALIFNGMVVSKRMARKQRDHELAASIRQAIGTGTTAEIPESRLPTPDFSITESQTYKLPIQPDREKQ